VVRHGECHRVTDALALVGFVLVVVGTWLIWPALAFVVAGAILVVVAGAIAWARATDSGLNGKDDG